MKKLLCFVLVIVSLLGCLSFTACGKNKKQAKLCYIDLKNNQSGFSVTGDDTAIAIGAKKGSDLINKINEYLYTFTSTAQNGLMNEMCALIRDDKSTYSPDYNLSDNDGGTLKIGMECGYEPYNWTQKTNTNGALPIKNVSGKYANGYDVQVAALVAEALNMKIEIYMYEWDSLIPAVTSGTIDLIIAGMSPTEDRKEVIDFTTPYYRSNLVIVTREDSTIANATTLAEIDKQGVRIAAQPGTFHLKALQEQTSSLRVINTLEDFVVMKIALEKGTIDGYVAEEPTAMAFCM